MTLPFHSSIVTLQPDPKNRFVSTPYPYSDLLIANVTLFRWAKIGAAPRARGRPRMDIPYTAPTTRSMPAFTPSAELTGSHAAHSPAQVQGRRRRPLESLSDLTGSDRPGISKIPVSL